ncbi:aromatic ring-hydroxylating oxygenase subunit alpha [Nitriliruptor alkaliphilus]|uniref:aromatic ring-hydroxylating oxygenase subunit alpha n=1 Tax=Nitriliruptor alkaliphilus TaxID=427918 RepID=UPI000696EBC8|nr:aromatic ring-hydroxylating dioxygenase subunit alpha [Nitriliruptor alkaliphilus]
MTTLDATDTNRYDRLIQEERVHSSLYTDQQIFAEELERIWYRTWVFVGHVSEVPEPNDYVRKNIGPQDVIMVRGKDGQVRLLLNRCTHRANLVCEDLAGNAGSFRCPYHGWTFRNTGELIGYPFRGGYAETRDELDLGLASLPRVAEYGGFVFGSFAQEGPSLEEHLGDAAGEIDRLLRLAPEGEIELNAGWLKHRTQANWKLIAENETDGYHPVFVHGSIFSVAESGIGDLYSDASEAVTRDLGGGHSENDLRPEFRRLGKPMGWFGTTEDRLPEYVRKIRERHGEAAEQILIEGSPHVMIFPNLFIAEIQVFNIQPLAPDLSVQHGTAIQFRGAPDINRRMLSQTIGSIGPAGLLLADDTEMYERNQRGLEVRRPEWLEVRRGLHRERRDERGHRIGTATDETGMRGFWRHYHGLMTEAGS